MKRDATPRPSLLASLVPIFVLIGAFGLGGWSYGWNRGVLLPAMLLAATAAGLLAHHHGKSWGDLQHAAGRKLADVLPALLILLAIGMLIGTWVASGTLPLLVSLGIRTIQPELFLLTAFLVTAGMSIVTGTSWGSAGTLGVALMGTAGALGLPLAPTAGAVVSGAYFGDKLSPLSDSTNISAIGAGAHLYAHIRSMLWTSIPSFLVACVTFALLAGGAQTVTAEAVQSAAAFRDELGSAFQLGFWALLPALFVLVALLARVAPVLALAGSSVVALIVAVLFQGLQVQDALASAVGGFKTSFLVDHAAPSDALTRLVERGGLDSMGGTLILVICAFLLTAGMEQSGALQRLLDALLSGVRSSTGLIVATMVAGATLIGMTSHGGVTALIVGGMFQPAYRRRGLAPATLSRSIEDSVTLVEPLMPWTVSAVYMASTLGVETVAYAPWALFLWCGPLFSLLWAGLAPVWDRPLARTRS